MSRDVRWIRGSLNDIPNLGGSNMMQIYGNFEGFGLNSALFGLVT